MRIYVGNMPFSMTDQQLRELFESYGKVENVDVITDRETGRPRGFAFVEMPEEVDAKKAIENLHEFNSEGRALNVNIARPREDRRNRGGSYGGRNRW